MEEIELSEDKYLNRLGSFIREKAHLQEKFIKSI